MQDVTTAFPEVKTPNLGQQHSVRCMEPGLSYGPDPDRQPYQRLELKVDRKAEASLMGALKCSKEKYGFTRRTLRTRTLSGGQGEKLEFAI